MSVQLEGKPHYILNATCDSRLGTVAAVSGFLASRQCYITEMQQFDDILSGRFFVRVNFFGEPGQTPGIDGLREFTQAKGIWFETDTAPVGDPFVLR